MRTAASLACVSASSPISEPTYRRLAASSRHARQISSLVSIRLKRSTSTSRAWPDDEPHDRDLDKRSLARIKARHFGVDRHCVECNERCGATPLLHRLLRFGCSTGPVAEHRSDYAPRSMSSSSRMRTAVPSPSSYCLLVNDQRKPARPVRPSAKAIGRDG